MISAFKIIRAGVGGASAAAFDAKNGLFGRDPGGRLILAIYKGVGFKSLLPDPNLTSMFGSGSALPSLKVMWRSGLGLTGM